MATAAGASSLIFTLFFGRAAGTGKLTVAAGAGAGEGATTAAAGIATGVGSGLVGALVESELEVEVVALLDPLLVDSLRFAAAADVVVVKTGTASVGGIAAFVATVAFSSSSSASLSSSSLDDELEAEELELELELSGGLVGAA